MNNHDGTFREEALLRGLALSDNGKEMAGMGVGVGDYDCDGLLDIVRTHYMNQATGLYRNLGKGNFEDVTVRSGLIHERRFVSWGTGKMCIRDRRRRTWIPETGSPIKSCSPAQSTILPRPPNSSRNPPPSLTCGD